MERSAKVTSTDAVLNMRAVLLEFAADARDGLTMLILEVRRGVDWLEQDRRRYWPEQIRRGSERLLQARNELERCQFKYGSEDPPSCYEQKKAWQRARARLQFCEERWQQTQRWIRIVRHELHEFEGRVAKMNHCLDHDLPRAAAALERMLEALDRYLASRPAAETSSKAGSEDPSPASQRAAEGNPDS